MREDSFYKEFWADFSEKYANKSDGRWRVSDGYSRLADWQQARWEGNCNGLMLIHMPLEPHEITSAEFYGEVWGGHNGSANRRFMLNGRSTYVFPEVQANLDHCCYHYPSIPLQTHHLVRGWNNLQLSVDRGVSFLGNFMLDEGCIRAYLSRRHNEVSSKSLSEFWASVVTDASGYELQDISRLWLNVEQKYHQLISSVEYYGKYHDFDEIGSCETYDWHGYTRNRKPMNTIGISTSAPYEITWDTTQIPDQTRALELMALVRFADGITYTTNISSCFLRRGRKAVELYPCTTLPSPFYSRISKPSVGMTDLSGLDFDRVEKVLLLTRVWDGGQGNVEDYFTLNGHQYDICTGTANHMPYETCFEVPLDHLVKGENVFRLVSDTEHHGIELLLPGPVLKIRFKE